MSDTLSIVLFSGMDDKLHAAATIAAGAAAMDMPVNILLMYWALDAFRADRIDNEHGLAYDASRPRWNEPVEHVGAIPWLETFPARLPGATGCSCSTSRLPWSW